MPEITRFKYHALTTGLTGRITLPFDQCIPEQASVTLPECGGFVHSKVENFNFRDIIRFDRAISFAAGSFSPKDNAFDATAAVTIEGLNILNVITADRITARVASSHPKDGSEPRITPIGSSFENLRIAGYKVEVDLAIDTFSEFNTATLFETACADPEVNRRVLGKLPTGETSCSMVRSIAGLGKEIQIIGNAVRIMDFGMLRLAELNVAERKRTVSMLQFTLGSTPDGSGTAGGAEGNGSGN